MCCHGEGWCKFHQPSLWTKTSQIALLLRVCVCLIRASTQRKWQLEILLNWNSFRRQAHNSNWMVWIIAHPNILIVSSAEYSKSWHLLRLLWGLATWIRWPLRPRQQCPTDWLLISLPNSLPTKLWQVLLRLWIPRSLPSRTRRHCPNTGGGHSAVNLSVIAFLTPSLQKPEHQPRVGLTP